MSHGKIRYFEACLVALIGAILIAMTLVPLDSINPRMPDANIPLLGCAYCLARGISLIYIVRRLPDAPLYPYSLNTNPK